MKNLHETDPEFMERYEHFALEEVVNEEGQQLEPSVRYMAILASLLGCQGLTMFCEVLPSALEEGLTPVIVKEIVYPVSYTHLDVYKRQALRHAI